MHLRQRPARTGAQLDACLRRYELHNKDYAEKIPPSIEISAFDFKSKYARPFVQGISKTAHMQSHFKNK